LRLRFGPPTNGGFSVADPTALSRGQGGRISIPADAEGVGMSQAIARRQHWTQGRAACARRAVPRAIARDRSHLAGYPAATPALSISA